MKTRFAPSPTGLLHIGNLRTALFNALMAQQAGGTFLLRVEDTDQERSKEEYVAALQEDLRWLGLDWQEGPVAQSDRGEVYDTYYQKLEETGSVYPCFCSQRELEISRKLQRSAGQAPRYAGTCAHLSAEEVQAKLAAGLKPTLRYRMPKGEIIEYDDLAQGHKRFESDDIGDFIIRRADGTPAFFFTNALDDSLMGVTHVLRGVDHETNTPRQLMLLKALGLEAPTYGHISLVIGDDNKPLSKRTGSRSIAELRELGYLPLAIKNFLARLGHKYEQDGFMSDAALAEGFDANRLGRSPSRFDPDQLQHWQKEAVLQASEEEILAWLRPVLDGVEEGHRDAFALAIRENVVLPAEATGWAERLFDADAQPSEAAAAEIAGAGSEFFQAALDRLDAEEGEVFKTWSKAVSKQTGAKGKKLFMPLRSALTGETHGPNLGEIFPLIDRSLIRSRLERAAEAE